MEPDEHNSTPARRKHPNEFQKRTLWIAITGAALLAIAAMSVYSIGVVTQVLQFLQPVLVPVAFAGILAYLLEPLVRKLVQRGTPHFRAMMLVWLGFHGILLLLFLSVAVPTIDQGATWLSAKRGKISEGLANFITYTADSIDTAITRTSEKSVEAVAKESQIPVEEAKTPGPVKQRVQEWLTLHGDEISRKAMAFIGSGVQGFVGMFGYFVGFLLVPLYLYYFLKESAEIKQTWSDYLPLKSSRFKVEVVDCLTEINGYLIAFFRGQMLVSMIDGVLVGLSLWLILQLPYWPLIGVFVALLGLIPYVGNIICWLAATGISIAHFSQTEGGKLVNTWDSMPQVWAYPLVVTAIFIFVQKINSLVTAPRIVGDAVGLHPLTVIFSVLVWSLLIGGLLGALLAVPLTASLKVLLRRYIWEKRVQPRLGSGFHVT